MMYEYDSPVWQRFLAEGVVLKGHFVLNSRLHSPYYFGKELIFRSPELHSEIALLLAERFADQDVQVVAGAPVGGAKLAQFTAYWLQKITGKVVLDVYANPEVRGYPFGLYRQTGRLVFRHGYGQDLAEKKVLAVEDVISTAKTARSLLHAIAERNGTVIALGAVCNRGQVTAYQLPLPKDALFHALTSPQIPMYPAHLCPLCGDNVPIDTEFGKGHRQNQWAWLQRLPHLLPHH